MKATVTEAAVSVTVTSGKEFQSLAFFAISKMINTNFDVRSCV